MQNPNLYSPEVWAEFVEKFGKTKDQFRLKTYPQFDPFFNFFERNEEIHELVKDPDLLKVTQHSFLPFVKILTKTPRYRYQEDAQCYNLDTKIRPISFASHFDTYIYAFYSFSLTKRYQCYIRSKGFDGCVLAYRTDLDGKCNIQFAKEIFEDIRKRTSSGQHYTAIALDVSGYFDSIDHRVLKEKWCKVLGCEELPRDQFKIYKSLTRYSYVNKNSILRHFEVDLKAMKKSGVRWQTLTDLIPDDIVRKRFSLKFDLLRARKLITTNQPKVDRNGVTSYKGIPQGSPLSALLSNVYLVDFDEWAFDLSSQLGFTYRRYCDDLLILCKSDQAAHINEQILRKIDEYKLKIQDRKTELIEFMPDSKGVVRSFNRKKISQQNAILNDSNGCITDCRIGIIT
jgi:RNA-directed DNA polymerase